MRKIDIISNLLQLIFPRVCQVCGEKLLDGEHIVCVGCKLEMPYTYDWLSYNNHLKSLLSVEDKIEWAAAYLFYNTSSDYSRLIKNIKFRNQYNIAKQLGCWYGTLLVDNGVKFEGLDYVIPVPLHYKRHLWRGYNQSYQIAKGIGAVYNLPIMQKCIKRIRNNLPQARQVNFHRRENVKDIFRVTDCSGLENKHILIVDDVCTTGSTLLEMIKCIKESVPSCKISVLTLARTKGDGYHNVGGRNIL